MKIGEQVRHRSRPDMGAGKIAELYPDGTCQIVFLHGRFSGIPIDTVVSIEAEIAAAQSRKYLLEEIHGEFETAFMDADAFFNASCAHLIDQNDYESEKTTFIQSWFAANITRSIDDEQAAAIAAVHGHVQVVARAGSGKTATLVNRAYFLQKHCGVRPSEIMLLAFNKKAAEEMEHRLGKLLDGQPTPYVMTFHALAHSLVHPEQNLIHDSSDGSSLALSSFVQKVIDDRLRHPEFMHLIRKVMVASFQEDWDKIEAGGYHLSKDEMLDYRRSLKRESLDGKFVKSFGEKLIANFLFEHQVDYLYEPAERGWLKNYHPDFKILRGDGTGVAIEYFGMSGDPDYDEMSETKRGYWRKKPGWTLIECSPDGIRMYGIDGFLRMLQTALEREGCVFRRMSEDEIWHQISRRSIDRFSTMTKSFIARCRKLELTPQSLQIRIDGDKARWQVEADFLGIIQPIYSDYLERLDVDDKEDFDGLMHRATRAVEDGRTSFSRHIKKQQGDLANLRFILIDEYQDFSKPFHSMVNAILSKNSSLQLFCVGDDWQAINGYAGSDLKYYKDFKTYFPSSERLHISTNYRSSAGIVEIGNAVMKKQGGKPASAHSTSAGSIWLAEKDNFQSSPSEEARHGDDKITPMVLRLVAKALDQGKKDVVLLSRTNNAPGYIDYGAHQGSDGDAHEKYIVRFGKLIRSYFPEHQRPRIKVSTAHGFKGLQADLVVVLDAVAGCYPLIHQDWIFLRVLGENIAQITEESRRLFYVALTRAVDTLVIFTEKNKKSPFLEDIEKQKPLMPIRWSDYPPVVAQSDRLLVMVGNQPYRGSTPTVSIKDFLKQDGYSPARPDGKWFWVKTFPCEDFSVESIRDSAWSCNADGVEVRILDEQDNLVEKYFIDHSVWILQPSE
ncbi:UvrD-helicase domain-containing protein [Thiobacillus denitrificans]|uniref:UvrD-helicase domain-containing protein n=1 Tax=Thiobacillus denitrificans TaxID=36861 RepID=UPI00075D804D|nr:UvrD-helicase domain-containing protein [Thiobacillus denitrificans]